MLCEYEGLLLHFNIDYGKTFVEHRIYFYLLKRNKLLLAYHLSFKSTLCLQKIFFGAQFLKLPAKHIFLRSVSQAAHAAKGHTYNPIDF